jgi:hypothetical protein
VEKSLTVAQQTAASASREAAQLKALLETEKRKSVTLEAERDSAEERMAAHRQAATVAAQRAEADLRAAQEQLYEAEEKVYHTKSCSERYGIPEDMCRYKIPCSLAVVFKHCCSFPNCCLPVTDSGILFLLWYCSLIMFYCG